MCTQNTIPLHNSVSLKLYQNVMGHLIYSLKPNRFISESGSMKKYYIGVRMDNFPPLFGDL